MKVRTFNDEMGSRSRSCRYCIVHEGNAYNLSDAVNSKLAVVQTSNYVKNGKWSNADITVTTNTATLVVIMRPFNYWDDNLDSCIDHILSEYKNGDSGVTREEAFVAFKFLYPEQYEKIMKKEEDKNELK